MMPSHYREAVQEIADSIQTPGITLQPETISIATQALELADHKYGPGSPKPLPYHNAEHSLDAGHRAVKLLDVTYDYIPDQYRPFIFDGAIISTAWHDDGQELGSVKGELSAVQNAFTAIEKSGSPVLGSDWFKGRIAGAIMSTVVERRSDGDIVQVNLGASSHDPLEFDVASADINGIGMEGGARMVKDATNLCYELFGNPTATQLYDFLLTQPDFLRRRLGDDRITAGLGHYFGDQADRAYQDLASEFAAPIASAAAMARSIQRRGTELRVLTGVATSMESASSASRWLAQTLSLPLVADEQAA